MQAYVQISKLPHSKDTGLNCFAFQIFSFNRLWRATGITLEGCMSWALVQTISTHRQNLSLLLKISCPEINMQNVLQVCKLNLEKCFLKYPTKHAQFNKPMRQWNLKLLQYRKETFLRYFTVFYRKFDWYILVSVSIFTALSFFNQVSSSCTLPDFSVLLHLLQKYVNT